jgi:hypothetical protein
MLLALILAISIGRLQSQAQPIEVRSSGQIVAAVEPFELVKPCAQVRSMWSIVYACGLTLIACVYTAVHPNMPAPGEGRISKKVRLTKFILLGLIAPEYMMLLALKQRYNASQIQRAAKSRSFFHLSHLC